MKYYALKDHVFYLELGVIGQDGAIVQKPTDPLARNFQAYVGGWREYTGYSATMTLSSDLSDGNVSLCSALPMVPIGK